MSYELSKDDFVICDGFEKYISKFEEEVLRAFIVDSGYDVPVSHYTSADGLLNILKTSKLRFTEASCLNDNTEGTYIFDVLKDFLKNDSEIASDFKDAIFAELEKGEFNNIYDVDCKRYFICCFSFDDDSLPLWNYYTKNPNMKGYNIQFNYVEFSLDLMAYNTNHSGNMYYEGYKIIYQKQDQINCIKVILDYIAQVWGKTKSNLIIKLFLNYLNSIRFTFKHFAFEPEKEIRFVIKVKESFFQNELKANAANDEIIKLQLKGDMVAPYIEIPFSKKGVKAIRVSPLIKDKAAIDSLKLVLNKYGYNEKIPINSSEIPLKY